MSNLLTQDDDFISDAERANTRAFAEESQHIGAQRVKLTTAAITIISQRDADG